MIVSRTTADALKNAPMIDVLNRLLAIEHRSLPMYLCEAAPWIHRGDEKTATALANIVADQQALSRRIAAFIMDHDGVVDGGRFPMDYTDTHFLGFDFLLKKLVECQRRDLADIEQCVAELLHEPEARQLAEEVLGAERAHLESLEELAAARK